MKRAHPADSSRLFQFPFKLIDKTPDFYTLPQIMRTVGCYIDQKGGRLAWIDMDGKKITLRYDNDQRYKILEQHTIPSLYDMFVYMYLHRHRTEYEGDSPPSGRGTVPVFPVP